MSEPLSGEEQRLLYLFADYAFGDDSGAGQDVADHFIADFNADPATYRQEIAPAREPMMSEEEMHGGSDGNR